MKNPQLSSNLRLRFSGDDDLLRRLFQRLLEKSPDVVLTEDAILRKSSDRLWASFSETFAIFRSLDQDASESQSLINETELLPKTTATEAFFLSRWADLNLKEIPVWAFSIDSDKIRAPATEKCHTRAQGIQANFKLIQPSLFAEHETSNEPTISGKLVLSLQETLETNQTLMPELLAQLPSDRVPSVAEVAHDVEKCLTEMARMIPALHAKLQGKETGTIVKQALSKSRPERFSLERSFNDSFEPFFRWNGPDMLAYVIDDVSLQLRNKWHRIVFCDAVEPALQAREWIVTRLSDHSIAPEELADGVVDAFAPLSRVLLQCAWKPLICKAPQVVSCDEPPIFSPRMFAELGDVERDCLNSLHDLMDSLPKIMSEIKFKLTTVQKSYLETIYQRTLFGIKKLIKGEPERERWSKAGISLPGLTDAAFHVFVRYLQENPIVLALWCGLFTVQRHDNELWVSLSPVLTDLCFNESILSKHNHGEIEFCESVIKKFCLEYSVPNESETRKKIVQQLSRGNRSIDKKPLIDLLS